MNIIDFHTHIYPEKISAKAVKSIGEFYGLGMDGDGTIKMLLDYQPSDGTIDFVVHSVAIDAGRVKTINDFLLSECEKNSRVYAFGTTHPDLENKTEELERIRSAGLRGVKIHPDMQQFNMDDTRMDEVYDYLSQTNMPILIHCGDYRYPYSHPQRLKKVLGRFPHLTVVAAHFGGWSVYDHAYDYLKDENCYLDTSSSFAFIGLRRAKELIRAYGAERIVFGSDFPMSNPKKELDWFFKMSLSDSENELILYKNARTILGCGE